MSKAGHYLKLDSSTSQHSRCVLQQLKGEEKNFVSMSLNLSNRGWNIRNFLKQSWGSSKSTERLREGGMMFVFVSFHQQLFLYCDTGKSSAEIWDWICAKLSWDTSLQASAKEDFYPPQLLPVPPSICHHQDFLGRRPNLFCSSFQRNIHTFEFRQPSTTSLMSYKTKAQAQGVINKTWLTKSKLLVHHLWRVHFAFPPWSHPAAASRNNLNVILTLYQFYSNLEQEDNKGKMHASGQNLPLVMS